MQASAPLPWFGEYVADLPRHAGTRTQTIRPYFWTPRPPRRPGPGSLNADSGSAWHTPGRAEPGENGA